MSTATTQFLVPVRNVWPHQWEAVSGEVVTDLPVASRLPKNSYVVCPPFIVHSKLFLFPKPQPLIVRGVNRHGLIVQMVNNYSQPAWSNETNTCYAAGTWHEVDFDRTVEGFRFKKIVGKMIAVLQYLTREVEKSEKRAIRAKQDFEKRGERCGTCPVCFGDYVVKPQNMVHHGFQRPGIGYIIGDCHGVGFAPFEVSCKGTVSWLEVLIATLKARQERLVGADTLQTMLVEVNRKYIGSGRFVSEKKELKRGEPEFDKAIANLKYELERDIKALTQDIAIYSKKIADWAPAKWPRVQK
jgi:hypothetical protein